MATLVMSMAPRIPMTDWKRQSTQVRRSHSEKVCLGGTMWIFSPNREHN